MILYRFKKLCRIFNAILYSISLILFVLTAAVPLLRIVEETGAFDDISKTLITCALPSDADGISTFHGQSYVIPSLNELQSMKDLCEVQEAQNDKVGRFYVRDHYIRGTIFGNPFMEDCSTVGKTHKDIFDSKFSEICVNEELGTSKYKTEIKKSKNFKYSDEGFVYYLLISILSLIVTYSTGYVLFGVSSISPLALFRGLK